jgi:hypothetical protein
VLRRDSASGPPDQTVPGCELIDENVSGSDTHATAFEGIVNRRLRLKDEHVRRVSRDAKLDQNRRPDRRANDVRRRCGHAHAKDHNKEQQQNADDQHLPAPDAEQDRAQR